MNRKNAILVLSSAILFFFISCSDKKDTADFVENKYQTEVYPESTKAHIIDLYENNLDKILVLLHNRIGPNEIIDFLNLQNDQYSEYINQLFGEGLIKKNSEGKFLPTFMIIDKSNYERFRILTNELGSKVAEIVIDRYPLIVDAYKKNSIFEKTTFESASFIILAEVMLNTWQIKNIEKDFLRAEPPSRGMQKYYLALLETEPNSKYQPFGIYTLKTDSVGNYVTNIYSNYIESENADVDSQNQSVVSGPSNSLELSGNQSLPIITAKASEKLSQLSSIITNDLINFLNNQRPQLVKYYLESVYKDETSFREWFFWIYKFIITEATNKLIERNFIKQNSFTKYYKVKNY